MSKQAEHLPSSIALTLAYGLRDLRSRLDSLTKTLQESLGVAADGIVGQNTLAAATNHDAQMSALRRTLCVGDSSAFALNVNGVELQVRVLAPRGGNDGR